MSSSTLSLSFENVNVFKMFATLVVGMATIFCKNPQNKQILGIGY